MTIAAACDSGVQVWKADEGLSKRVKRLRDEYFSFEERDHFRNEVIGYTTGEPDDVLFSSYHWGVAPEAFIFSKAFTDTLAASAVKVTLPPGFWGMSLPRRRAVFFSEVVTKYMPVQILEGELIAGGHFNTALSKTLTPEETKEWKKREKKWFRKSLVMNVFGIGNCGAVPGHLIPDYPSVIKNGFKGLVEKFEGLKDKKPAGHRDYLEALIVCAEAARDFAARYAGLADKLARAEKDAGRAAELREMARICRKVPWEPAGTFQEALQSLWITHMLVMSAESYPGPGLSPGRVDQYLYPYYKSDLESGRITRDWAKELILCWMIKHNYAYDFMGRVGTKQGINSSFGQLITIGGLGPNGEDMSNDLTMLLLDAIEELNMLEPKPNVRLHKNVGEGVLDKVVHMVAKAQGSPFLLNFDEISMKALRWAGLPEDKLWDYAPVGCLENTLQGNDRSGTVDVNLNLAKPVELVFGSGRDLKLIKRIGARTPDAASLSSFAEFKAAYFAQLSKLVDYILEMAEEADAMRAKFEPTPYLSALVGGCAESGRDVTAGGAEHNFITVEGVAFATAVDSLAAVKKLVFEEGRVKMADLKKAVKKNFEGHEPLRQMLINRAPKYGNDDPEADGIAAELNSFLAEKVGARKSPATGRRYRMGYLSWNYWVIYAAATHATPDGRKRGTYLSNGVCPVTGADHKGPVSVARSVFSMNLEKAPNGGSHTISLNPAMARTEHGRENIKAYLRAYGVQGGSALQINMIDPATLRKAQANPGEYGNLLVRVTGYNAYFTSLGKEIQDEIIARESHRLGGE